MRTANGISKLVGTLNGGADVARDVLVQRGVGFIASIILTRSLLSYRVEVSRGDHFGTAEFPIAHTEEAAAIAIGQAFARMEASFENEREFAVIIDEEERQERREARRNGGLRETIEAVDEPLRTSAPAELPAPNIDFQGIFGGLDAAAIDRAFGGGRAYNTPQVTTRVFESAEDVYNATDLSQEQKRQLLSFFGNPIAPGAQVPTYDDFLAALRANGEKACGYPDCGACGTKRFEKYQRTGRL